MEALVEMSAVMAGMGVAVVASRVVLGSILAVTFRQRP